MAKIDVAKALMEHIERLQLDYFEAIEAGSRELAKDLLKRLEGYCDSLKSYYKAQL